METQRQHPDQIGNSDNSQIYLSDIAIDLLRKIRNTTIPAWIPKHFIPESAVAWAELVRLEFVVERVGHGFEDNKFTATPEGREWLWDYEYAQVKAYEAANRSDTGLFD